MYKLGFCIHGPHWCAYVGASASCVLSGLAQPLPPPQIAGSAAAAGNSALGGDAPRTAWLLRIERAALTTVTSE